MREIFIPNHRNKGGKRYGFVRFKGISDERKLERQLDNIIVDGLKLYVNVPKYGRGKMKFEEYTAKPRTQTEGHNNEVTNARHMAMQYRTPLKSYAKVVSTTKTDVGQRKHLQPPHPRHIESQSSVQLEVAVGERKWHRRMGGTAKETRGIRKNRGRPTLGDRRKRGAKIYRR